MLITLQTADAVKTELNNATPGTFGVTFTAERKIIPTYKLTELDEVKVSVVPRSIDISQATRATSAYEIGVDVGVQRKVGKTTETADVEELAELTGEIVEYITQRNLSALPGIRWQVTKNDPIYDADMLEEQRVFMSVISLTYRGVSN